MLTIDIEALRGILFVRLNGNIDSNTVSILNNEVTSFIENCKVRNVVFNFSNVNNIDNKGISEILYNHYLCIHNNGYSLLSNIPDKLRSNDLIKHMKVVNNDLEAIKEFNI